MKRYLLTVSVAMVVVFGSTAPVFSIGNDTFVNAVKQTTFDTPDSQFDVGTYFLTEDGVNYYEHVSNTGTLSKDYISSTTPPTALKLVHITGYIEIAKYMSPTTGVMTTKNLTLQQYNAIGTSTVNIPSVTDSVTAVGAIFGANKAYASIAFDSAKDCGFVSPGTSITCAVTAVSTTNGLIVWGQYTNSNTDDTPTGANAPTYNGVIGTFINKIGVATNSFSSFWAATSTVSSASLVCKWTSSTYHDCVESTYTGVSQTTSPAVPDANTTNSNAATATPNCVITPGTVNDWVIGYIATEAIGAPTANGGIAQIRIKQAGSLNSIEDSNQPTTTAATTISATQTGNTWGMQCATFQPAATAAGGQPKTPAIIFWIGWW